MSTNRFQRLPSNSMCNHFQFYNTSGIKGPADSNVVLTSWRNRMTSFRDRLERGKACALSPQMKLRVDQWLEFDSDEESRHVVQHLAQTENEGELNEILGSRLQFGTAGLRGLMGPGFNRMNAVTVQQTTQGLCRYLQRVAPDALNRGGVVIGYDGRRGSERFAQIAAAVFVSEGVKARLLRGLVPTPLVAFAVAHLGCAAGVMVTASHNPKDYNGYKVYWGNGCQIIPPHDEGISAAIEEDLGLWDLSAWARPCGLLSDPLHEVAEAYYAKMLEAVRVDVTVPDGFEVVYTPLHGVGLDWVRRAFHLFGLPEPVAVPEQAEPDADFPTVEFPNPEEGAGTWSLAFRTAEGRGASLVLANDPDADRLAAAERDPLSPSGWRAFSGNEIGALLADWALRVFAEKNPGVPLSKVAMLSTIVSSQMLGAMAAAEGFHFEQTLTGFKWLGNAAESLEARGFHVVFAFEEAIGFMFGALEKDKDGVSAAAAFAQMAADLAARGLTVGGRLRELQRRYGCYVGRQGYFLASDPASSRRVFEHIREGGYPEALAGVRVEAVRDLGFGLDTSQPDGKALLPWNTGDMNLTLFLEGKVTLTLRASGTEPKLKYYLEVPGSGGDEHRKLTDTIEAALENELVQPSRYGLVQRRL
eukprot:CAMPEP_0177626712 /NCGR_PEP_ID=MMETSP0419_2-20121207/30803_1 /TAXON_ID=582737 /ORGANISM="Tetraselmis sp., Strain GSL018" /LENGTH=643 /DNA_ID=CAMNT_0019127791 /DNA_START=33 /DNA_END=1965 /DNA_ORIENTATION=+